MIHLDRNSVRNYEMIQIVAGPEKLTSDCCMIRSSRSDVFDLPIFFFQGYKVQGTQRTDTNYFRRI